MGPIIAIVTSIAMLVFWLSRAASGAAGAANDIANLPRRLKHARKTGRVGLELVTDVREAAAVLMVAVARLSGDKRVSKEEDEQIQNLMVSNMAWPKDEVEDFVVNIRWLTRDFKQPISTLSPMVAFLRGKVSKQEAADLADMLTEIAITDGAATESQMNFIYSYRELMGLNSKG